MNATRCTVKRLAVVGLAAAAFGVASSAVAQPRARAAAIAPEKIEVWPVRDNIYMLVGAGGNTTVQLGADGVLVVDTKLAAASDTLLAAIREISDKPIRYVINTHVHPDHVGGNEKIAAAGSTIAGGNVSGAIADASVGAAVIAHENVLVRMSGQETPPPFAAWPTDTFFVPEKDFFFNGEAVQVIHKPAAHTDGDSIVFFRRSDVISAGDVFTTTLYPVIRPEDGGGIDGVIAALNDIIALTVPAEKQEGGTMVIPGHGRLADEADVVEYRDMVTIVRDRVRSMIEMGMTLQQVQAAQPTRDYDGRYGATEGFWTTTRFVEAVYNNLASGASGGRSAAARE
jgi:cyclase